MDSMLMLEHGSAKVEEGWECQPFMEAFWVAIWACLPETQGGIHVPPTAPDWQCSISCPSRNVSHCPATGSGRQRVSTDTSHSQACLGLQCHRLVQNAGAPPQTKVCPSLDRWIGDSRHWWHTQRMSSQKVKRRKAGREGPKGTLLRSLL